MHHNLSTHQSLIGMEPAEFSICTLVPREMENPSRDIIVQCVPPSSGKNITQDEATDRAKKIKSQFSLNSEEFHEIQVQVLR